MTTQAPLRLGLRGKHQPRPWTCNTDEHALFCTHHGDCTCRRDETAARLADDPYCPLHGIDTEHPLPQPITKGLTT